MRSFFATLLLCASSVLASAEDWPARPITMIVPYAAGGPVDTVGRIMAQGLSEALGQQVIIENVGGAGGMTGSKRVADASPDGYTIGIGTVGTHAQGQTLYKRPLYNSQTDFTPVALLAQVPILLTVRKDLPAKDFKESDRIRDELAAMGVTLKDGKDPKTGEMTTTWEVAR